MLFFALRTPLFILGAYAVGVLAVSAVSSATRDLSAAYDLTQSGSPNVEVVANIKLSRDLAAAHPQHEAKFRSCSPKREEDLLRAIGSYRKYIATTIKYLETQGPGPEYKNWFGEPNDARVSTVYGVFTKLRIYDLSDYTFDCGCRDPLPHIRVDPLPRIIRLCTAFWNFRPDGRAWSHAMFLIAATCRLPQNGGLEVLTNEWAGLAELATDSPDEAVANVDSYVEFVVLVNRLLVGGG